MKRIIITASIVLVVAIIAIALHAIYNENVREMRMGGSNIYTHF